MNGAEPFFEKQGDFGILLIHGFCASVAEMRPLGKFLSKNGFSVRCILLPGHGTSVEDLAKCKYQDWLKHARAEYNKLFDDFDCKKATIIGLSMGGTITLNLASQLNEDNRLRGIVTMSAPAKFPKIALIGVQIVKKFIKVMKKGEKKDLVDKDALKNFIEYKERPMHAVYEFLKLVNETYKKLHLIKVPAFLIHSNDDLTIKPKHLDYIIDAISTPKESLRVLRINGSGHTITLDAKREYIYNEILAWLKNF